MAHLVYVAGPITDDPWDCVRKATIAAHHLAAAGLHAYLPQLSVLHEMIDPQPYERWIEHGLLMVERCDAVLRLPGDSPGADREVEHARDLGLIVEHWPASYLHPDSTGFGYGLARALRSADAARSADDDVVVKRADLGMILDEVAGVPLMLAEALGRYDLKAAADRIALAIQKASTV